MGIIHVSKCCLAFGFFQEGFGLQFPDTPFKSFFTCKASTVVNRNEDKKNRLGKIWNCLAVSCPFAGSDGPQQSNIKYDILCWNHGPASPSTLRHSRQSLWGKSHSIRVKVQDGTFCTA